MRLVSSLAFLVAALATAAAAQPGDWSTVAMSAGAAVPFGAGFGDAWDAAPGPTLRVEAPAYGGHASAAVRAVWFEARDDVPDFRLVVPTVGWGPAIERGPVRFGASADVGIAWFSFDDREALGLESEIEVVTGLRGGTAVRLGRGVEAWAEVGASRVALFDPTTLWTASGGLALRLGAPDWLQGVLR